MGVEEGEPVLADEWDEGSRGTGEGNGPGDSDGWSVSVIDGWSVTGVGRSDEAGGGAGLAEWTVQEMYEGIRWVRPCGGASGWHV